jgi:G3E family GTPase
MSSPFDPLPASVPVTIITHGPVPADPSARLLHLDAALHEHEPGDECVACAARGDIRAMLFDLLQSSRSDRRPITSVLVDATDLKDPQPVIDRVERGKLPAFGLRDHTVARSFHLAKVV